MGFLLAEATVAFAAVVVFTAWVGAMGATVT